MNDVGGNDTWRAPGHCEELRYSIGMGKIHSKSEGEALTIYFTGPGQVDDSRLQGRPLHQH
jgi:hypothetical protein